MMMMTERGDEEFAEWPRAPDPVHEAIGALLVAIIESTKEGSRARTTAMRAVFEAQGRIIDALRAGPTLQ
jgi:hypothetical protein